MIDLELKWSSLLVGITNFAKKFYSINHNYRRHVEPLILIESLGGPYYKILGFVIYGKWPDFIVS
jgi:hypothetical protein